MRIAVVFAVAAPLLTPSLARAETSEEDQKRACMGDAFKLCASEIPDRAAVRRCMGAKRDQLSTECKLAFDGASARGKAR